MHIPYFSDNGTFLYFSKFIWRANISIVNINVIIFFEIEKKNQTQKDLNNLKKMKRGQKKRKKNDIS